MAASSEPGSSPPGGAGFGGLIGGGLETTARAVTRWSGSSSAFAIAVGAIVVWALTGPVFHFSDTWQLVINTGTTIVTFLMVFLIQRSQNKDAQALHLKLNEIVAALQGASNRMINVEDLTEAEVQELHERFQDVAARAASEEGDANCHSIEEAVRETVHDVRTAAGERDSSGLPSS